MGRFEAVSRAFVEFVGAIHSVKAGMILRE